MFESPSDFFFLGSGITAILFVFFLLYTKKDEQKKDEYIKKLESESFESTQIQQSQRYKISELETAKKHNEEKLFDKLEKLEYSRLALESEKNRMIRTEEEMQKKTENEKYRLWAEHEQNVIAEIKQIIASSSYTFPVFDNEHLPVDFDFQLKPDCMIQFLDQYIIFDAKKSKNPKAYIAQQVKHTAEKFSIVQSEKVFNKIYSTIFFIMPEEEVNQLSKKIFQESGYTFVIISRNTLPAIFHLLHKISQYERLSDFNIQEREDLIHLIASYDTHISYQNAVNFVLAKQSFEIDAIQKNLPQNFISDVQSLQESTKVKTLNALEVRKYAKNKDIQKKEIAEIMNPKPDIKKDIVEKSEELFIENLQEVRNIKIEHA